MTTLFSQHQNMYASDPRLDPGATDLVTITMPRADWISIRSSLDLAASREEDYAKRVQHVTMKYQSKESAKKLRRIDQLIKAYL